MFLLYLLSSRVLEGDHASFVESVPFRYTAFFTLFQCIYFLVCFGVTWIPIAGILLALPFFVLITIRQYILPKLFKPHHLRELDAAEYEEIAGTPRLTFNHSCRVCHAHFLTALSQVSPAYICLEFILLL